MGLNLSLSNIVKRYNGKTILDRCSVSFGSGTVHVLMGPNGCGKSTILRICALLEPPDDGGVLYHDGDRIVPHDLFLKRRITLMLPHVGVFNATVFKNAAFGLAIRNVPKDIMVQKVNAALDAVGLGHKRHQDARTLSSGETQRLGIARAMVIGPEILFLDEPTASIDEENTAMIEEIIGVLRKEERTTIIMTTHDHDQAARLADCVITVRGGSIEVAGRTNMAPTEQGAP